MGSLADFRKQYPQYDSIGDAELAEALRRKYYANLPEDDYYKRIGGRPEEKPGVLASKGADLVRGAGNFLSAFGDRGLTEVPGLVRRGRDALAGVMQDVGVPQSMRNVAPPEVQAQRDAATDASWRAAVKPASQWAKGAGEAISGSVIARQAPAWKDADGFWESLDSLSSTVAEGAAPTIAGMLTGMLTKNPRAAMAVMGVTSAPQTYEGIRQRQDATGKEDLTAALAGTIGVTALDTLTGAGRAASSIGRESIKEAFDAGTRSVAKETLKTSAEEGVTEALQNVIEQTAGGENPTTRASLEQTLEAGLAGTLGGAAFGGSAEVYNSVSARRAREAAKQIEPLHTVEIVRPGETAPQPVDIMSMPTEDGQVLARTAKGDMFATTLAELEEARTQVAEGEPAASLQELVNAAASARNAPATEDTTVESTTGALSDDPDFDEVVNRLELGEGMPREYATEVAAFQLGRERLEAAAATAPEPAMPGVPGVIPSIMSVTPTATFAEQTAPQTPPAAAPAPEQVAPAPVEPLPAPEQMTPIEPMPAPEQLAPIEPAPAPEQMAPVEPLPVPEPLAPIEPMPAPEQMALPQVVKKVTPERIAQATQLLTEAAALPAFQQVEITPKIINRAAQLLVRHPEAGAATVLAEVTRVPLELLNAPAPVMDTSVAEAPAAFEPEALNVPEGAPPVTAELPAPFDPASVGMPVAEVAERTDIPAVQEAPVYEAPAPEVIEPVPEAQFAAEEVAPQELAEVIDGVTVTKLPSGVARGVKPVQRGSQGTARGRPVEGAKALTEGMRAEQRLTADLETARGAREIADSDVAQTLAFLRPPATEQALKKLPPEQRNQWIGAIAAQRDVDQMQEQVSKLPREILGQPNPERLDAEATLGKLQQRLDTAQQDIVRYARDHFEQVREARRLETGALREMLKDPTLSAKDRREITMALKNRKVSYLASEDLVGSQSEAAGEALDAARKVPTAKNVVATMAKRDDALGGLARALLPITPDVRMRVVGPQEMEAITGHAAADGAYHPPSRTILLAEGMKTDHVPLHEVVHAIVSWHVSHNTTEGKQLSALYKAFLKETTNSQQYGFDNAQEFVAEALSSETFRKHLSGITLPSDPNETLLQRVARVLKALFNRVLGRENSAPVVDYLDRILSIAAKASKSQPLVDTGGAMEHNPAQQKINRGLRKAQASLETSGLEGIDEMITGVKQLANTLTPEDRKQARSSARKGYLTPKVAAVKSTSLLIDQIKSLREGLGGVLEEMKVFEQNLRGMHSTMRTALGRRSKELRKFVSENGQSVISATMHTARINRVDVTAYKNVADALANDPVAKRYRDKINDPNTSPRDVGVAKRGLTRRTDDIETVWKLWDHLGTQPGGQKLYKELRQFYKDMYAAMRVQNDKAIRALGLDTAATEKLINAARGDLNEDGVTDDNDTHPGVPHNLFPQEYFPFRRFGEHVLLVKAKSRADYARYHFDTREERDLHMAQLARARGLTRGSDEYNNTFEKFDGLEDIQKDLSENGVMLRKMFDIIDTAPLGGANTVDPASAKSKLKDQLYQTYLLTLPERSMRKQFIHAELTEGNTGDIERVFNETASQFATQLPKAIFGPKLQNKIDEAYAALEGGDVEENAALRVMIDVIAKRVRSELSPDQIGTFERGMNKFTFLMLMSGPVSAAVQGLQIPLQNIQRMGVRYGYGKALSIMAQYNRAWVNPNTIREADPYRGTTGWGAYTLGNTGVIKKNPLRRELWKILHEERDLFSQKASTLLLSGAPSDSLSRKGTGAKMQKAARIADTIVHASGAVFGSIDQMSREITGMAYAELHYKQQRAKGASHAEAIESAVEAAVRNTNETGGDYTSFEKPDVFRGNMLKRMLGYLRTYSYQRYAYFARQFKAIFKGSPTQTRMQALHETTAVMLVGGLLGGAVGVFGIKAFAAMINAITRLMRDDEEQEKAEREDPLGANDVLYRVTNYWIPYNFGSDSTLAQIADKGALSMWAGTDLSTRLSQNDMWLHDWHKGDNKKEEIANFLFTNLSPQVSNAGNVAEGLGDLAKGEWLRAAAKLSPAAIRGIPTALRLAAEGERSPSTNKTIMGPEAFSTTDLVKQAFGAAPLKLAKVKEKNRAIQEKQGDLRDRRAELMKEYRTMRQDDSGTYEDYQKLFGEIDEYNRKAPDPKYWVTEETLLKSLNTAEKSEDKSLMGIQMTQNEANKFYRRGQ